MPRYSTIASPIQLEIDKIKGSRFIADVASCASAAEAEERIQSIRDEFPDATHHCWAWRLDSDEAFRYSDDGEPSGSAGRPILNQILGSGLSFVVVVVTRYYGGTKLGTGGLVRAYGAAAKAILEAVDVVIIEAKVTLAIAYGYELEGTIKGVLAENGLEFASAEYGVRVSATISVLVEDAERIARAIEESTAGRVKPLLQDP